MGGEFKRTFSHQYKPLKARQDRGLLAALWSEHWITLAMYKAQK